MMGFETWADGAIELDYLNLCRDAPKYKTVQWYLLKEEDELLSSLIVYKFEGNAFGIGSISTPAFLRKKGFASKLISQVIELLENECNASAIFLYSNIESDFYEKFGFEELPKSYQLYNKTTCMVRVVNLDEFLRLDLGLPKYF